MSLYNLLTLYDCKPYAKHKPLQCFIVLCFVMLSGEFAYKTLVCFQIVIIAEFGSDVIGPGFFQ